jgi:hypothetical protein
MFFLNVLAIIWCYYNLIAGKSYLYAFLHGIVRAVLVVQTTHAASHFSMSMNPMFNRWSYRVGTVLIGLWAPKSWDLQHVVAHHGMNCCTWHAMLLSSSLLIPINVCIIVYTNEWPWDSDSAFPIKSILYNQKRFGYHKYQHLYMWIVYALFIPLVCPPSVPSFLSSFMM